MTNTNFDCKLCGKPCVWLAQIAEGQDPATLCSWVFTEKMMGQRTAMGHPNAVAVYRQSSTTKTEKCTPKV